MEELLLDVGDDFLEHATAGAAALAKHRGSDTLDACDVRLHVERVWGMPLPGHGDSAVLTKRPAPTELAEAQAARLAAVKKAVAAAASGASGSRRKGAAGTDSSSQHRQLE